MMSLPTQFLGSFWRNHKRIAKKGNPWLWDFPKNKRSFFILVLLYFYRCLNLILPHLNIFSHSESQFSAWMPVQRDICLLSFHLSAEHCERKREPQLRVPNAVSPCDTLGTETGGYSLSPLRIVSYEVPSKTNEALQLRFLSNEVAITSAPHLLKWDSCGPCHVRDNTVRISTRSKIIREGARQCGRADKRVLKRHPVCSQSGPFQERGRGDQVEQCMDTRSVSSLVGFFPDSLCGAGKASKCVTHTVLRLSRLWERFLVSQG